MGRYAKAVAAGVTTFGGAIYQALLDDHITGNEWVVIITSTVVAVGAVFSTANTVGSVSRTPPPS